MSICDKERGVLDYHFVIDELMQSLWMNFTLLILSLIWEGSIFRNIIKFRSIKEWKYRRTKDAPMIDSSFFGRTVRLIKQIGK